MKTEDSELKRALVSACLMGCECRYDGNHEYSSEADQLQYEYFLIAVCPEEMGDLGTPRPAAEIRGGDGHDVLDGKARVETLEKSEDVTAAFIKGAEETLKLTEAFGAKTAFMKSHSPSCGNGGILTAGEELPGDGVTTALLKRNGIEIHAIQ